jgi:hypothetical protein
MPEVWTFELRAPQPSPAAGDSHFFSSSLLASRVRSECRRSASGGWSQAPHTGGREEGRGKREEEHTHTHAHTIDGRTGRTETPPSTVWRGHIFLFPLDLGILSSLSLTLGPLCSIAAPLLGQITVDIYPQNKTPSSSASYHSLGTVVVLQLSCRAHSFPRPGLDISFRFRPSGLPWLT